MLLDFQKTLFVIGAGNMGAALIKGWLNKGIKPAFIKIYDPYIRDDIAQDLRAQGIEIVADFSSINNSDYILLAVKPQKASEVLSAIAKEVDMIAPLISIMAGKTADWIAGHFSTPSAVIRVMPNTPVCVQKGVCGIFLNDRANNDTVHEEIGILFEAVGSVFWLKSEQDIDNITAISGSGPAYFYYFCEILAYHAHALGFDEGAALELAQQTLIGAAKMVEMRGEPPSILREQVTSPGGTTQAAIETFQDNQRLSDLMGEAVEAARIRSITLGQS